MSERNGTTVSTTVTPPPVIPSTHPRRRVTFSDWWNGRSIDEEIARRELRIQVLEDQLAAEQAVNEFYGLKIEQMRGILQAEATLANVRAGK